MKHHQVRNRLGQSGKTLLLFAALAVCTSSQASEGEEEAIAYESVTLVLSDATPIAADLHLPEGKPPFSTVIRLTPYGTDSRRKLGADLAAAGFAVLHVNLRGTGGSGGKFLPFIDEEPDLLEILNWTIDQPWSNGRVGLIGTSSGSYSAQLLAATGHPAVKALVNISGLTDTELLFFPGGAFRLNTLYPWLQYFYVGNPIRDINEWNRRFMAAPMNAEFEWEPGLLGRMAAGNVPARQIKVPILHYTGWNDVVYRQTLSLYQQVGTGSGQVPFQRLVIGPWMHNQIGSTVSESGDETYPTHSQISHENLYAEVADWFHHYLDGEELGLNPAKAVKVYRMGADQWQEYAQWPPAASQAVTYYLQSPKAEGRGTLSSEPENGQGSASFTSDPDNPVATFGGVNSHIFPHLAGPRDQTQFLDRADVLVYTGDALAQPMILSGPMNLSLHASSTCPDFDLAAKLIVVHPDGYRRIIEDGIIRASAAPGFDSSRHAEPQAFALELGQVEMAINPGERLEVHIAGSNFPKYDRNPCTGEDSLSAPEYAGGETRIYSGGSLRSELTLLVQN